MFKVTSELKLKVQGIVKVFSVGSVINLPEKSAQMFIQQGKLVPVQEKSQVVINNESEYEDYFQAAAKRISQNYPAGTLDYIRQTYPERWSQFIHAEERLNHLWDSDTTEFKKANDDWQEILLELIKLFKQNQ